MIVELSPDEQNHLIWQREDYFESVRGLITFTVKENAFCPISDEKTVRQTFFFKDEEIGFWGKQEWTASFKQEIPNGPVSLIFLRRGEKACVFGVVSLVNGAWAFSSPVTRMPYYKKSSRRRRMAFWGKLAALAFFPLFAVTLPLAIGSLGLLARPNDWALVKMQESWRGAPSKEISEVEKSARALMHRLAEAEARSGERTHGRL